MYHLCSAILQVTEVPRWERRCTCKSLEAAATNPPQRSSKPPNRILCTLLCWGTTSCHQEYRGEDISFLKVEENMQSWRKPDHDMTTYSKNPKPTEAASFWLAPRPVRKTIDELETLQLKSCETLELFILAKIVVLLCFLDTKHGKVWRGKSANVSEQTATDMTHARKKWSVHEYDCLYPEEAVVRRLWSATTLHTRRKLLPPSGREVIIIVTCFMSGQDNMKGNSQIHNDNCNSCYCLQQV